MLDKINIAVIGLGYVGAPCAYFLAKTCLVTAIDLDEGKLADVQAGVPLLEAEHFGPLLKRYGGNIRAARAIEEVVDPAFVFLSTPTNADPATGTLNIDGLQSLIAQCLAHAPSAIIVIRSTVPVGFTADMQAAYPEAKLVFWPEFVRESQAYVDNLKPDRIIFGGNPGPVAQLRALIQSTFDYPDEIILEMGSTEAETVKLAANAYLATRVAFMNEVDSLCRSLSLNAAQVNAGLCSDMRIGTTYANPSLGFGGYCLPKDTLQFATLTKESKGNLAQAILASNEARMNYFVELCLQKEAQLVGFHRLVMKPGSDNAREAASLKIASRLIDVGVRVQAYEPVRHLIPDNITSVDAQTLFATSDLVLAESWEGIPEAHRGKVVCPDLSGS